MVFPWCAMDKPQCTRKGRNNNLLTVDKRSGKFLTGTWTQATIRHGETSSLRSEFLSLLEKGGNEERDRRLQVVKLLIVLSYCV